MGRKKIIKKKKNLVGDTPGRIFVIDPDDSIQWRYEMVRQATLSRLPIGEISKEFGCSRDMYFYYKGKFESAGMLGLADCKPGPTKPRKRTEEVENRIIQIRFKRPELNMYEIQEILREEGYEISPRSVGRTLTQLSHFKKKIQYLQGFNRIFSHYF